MHAQPGARRSEVQGVHGEAVKVRIQARPLDGAANQALLELLADALRVPRSRCALIAGETGRRKRVRIEGPDRAHAENVLAGWIQTRS